MNTRLRLTNYITRYAPSYKRVLGYIQRKKIEDPESLLAELGYHEGLMCDIWLKSFLSIGKGEYEIFQKLIKKEFPKKMIQEKISLIKDDLYNWDIHKANIYLQIDTLLRRGKALRYIGISLIGKYPYFREQIFEYIQNISDTEGLKKEVQKFKTKYNLSVFSEKQKFYTALMRKGFTYSQIREEVDHCEDR